MTRSATVAVTMALAMVGSVVAGAAAWPLEGSPKAYAVTAPEPSTTATSTGAATSTPTSTPTRTRRPCDTVPHPFDPRTVTIPGITKRARVVAPPRIGLVPGPPPLTTAGKEMFAWDKQNRIRPGWRRGNVRMNAHTWPDGSAVGNRMLRRLDVGDRIVVHGVVLRMCYRVTKRIEVRPWEGLRRYYRRDGKPHLAIVVCSGRRLGPGVWEKRTIWYAKPSL